MNKIKIWAASSERSGIRGGRRSRWVGGADEATGGGGPPGPGAGCGGGGRWGGDRTNVHRLVSQLVSQSHCYYFFHGSVCLFTRFLLPCCLSFFSGFFLGVFEGSISYSLFMALGVASRPWLVVIAVVGFYCRLPGAAVVLFVCLAWCLTLSYQTEEGPLWFYMFVLCINERI